MLLLLLSFVPLSVADDSTVSPAYSYDPYLQYRPPFVRSLPVQILLTGIVYALIAVLFIHLLFTAQYHWPLAPVNYVLQMSAVVTLLISLSATLYVILSATMIESQRWPYMLSYIAVNVPPLDVQISSLSDWSVVQKATWLAMNASTSVLVQITHIHFLTLLYPSSLEGRLIFALLGPLAIVSAAMQLIPIQGLQQKTISILVTSAIRNVCNATLSLLFTVALFIWGFFVNRDQAWRTDGGTAVFGTSALVLAVISTALNFFYVDREEEYVWLPGLMGAVILWQSFLGWWWWVGAGTGNSLLGASETSEVEEKLRRQEKRELKRRQAKERRNATKMRAKMAFKGVTGAFGGCSQTGDLDSATTIATTDATAPVTSIRYRRGRRPWASDAGYTDVEPELGQDPKPNSPSKAHLILPEFVSRWFASLSLAHHEAAHAQEVERVQRISELGTNHPIRKGGWGLGSFGWRMTAQERWWLANRRGSSLSTPARSTTKSTTKGLQTDDELELNERTTSSSFSSSPPLRRSRSDMTLNSRIESSEPPESIPYPTPPTAYLHGHVHHQTLQDRPQRSIWWWGPLRRWRLQDTTVYRPT